MKSFFPNPTLKVDDRISYAELVAADNSRIPFTKHNFKKSNKIDIPLSFLFKKLILKAYNLL